MGVGAGHLVQRFYREVWNKADETVAREILHAGLRFKASLGPVRTGPEGFIDYMRSIHAGLVAQGTKHLAEGYRRGDDAGARRNEGEGRYGACRIVLQQPTPDRVSNRRCTNTQV